MVGARINVARCGYPRLDHNKITTSSAPWSINFRPDAHTANTYLQLLLVDWADYFEGQALNTDLLRRQAKLEQNPFWSIFFCTWEWWYNFCPSDNFKLFPVLKLKCFFYQATYTNIPSGEKGNYNKDKIVKPSTKLKREREKKFM